MGKKKSKEDPVDARKELLKELRSLIKDIPEEGLIFLIKQANTILYNMRVDELNKAQERLDKKRSSPKNKGKAASTKINTKDKTVSIERSSFGRSFVLIIGETRKIMSEEELAKVVRIAFKAEGESEAAERIYTWFKRNRDDVLIDGGLKKSDPVFKTLYTYLKEHFSIT